MIKQIIKRVYVFCLCVVNIYEFIQCHGGAMLLTLTVQICWTKILYTCS